MLRYFLLLSLFFFFVRCAGELTKDDKIIIDDSLKFSELVERGDSYYNNNPRLRDKALVSIEFYKKALSKANNLSGDELHWKLSRSYGYLSKYSLSASERSSYAELGISFAKKSLELSPSLEAQYYYLLNRGLYAEVNVLSAMSLVGEMEADAYSLVSKGFEIDYGGVYRFLALLYYKAPAFLLKGEKAKAASFFKKACLISPEYPPNLFYYASFLLDKGERDEAMVYISAMLSIKSMHEDFAGELEYWKDKTRKLQSK